MTLRLWLIVLAVFSGPPANAADRLVGDLKMVRDNDRVTISGTASGLPAGTKISVEIAAKPGRLPYSPDYREMEGHVGNDGTFSIQIVDGDGYCFPVGILNSAVEAYFDAANQPPEILRQVGAAEDDKPLKIWNSPDFVPEDKEFPNEGRHLEAVRKVTSGPIPGGCGAILAVKAATMTLPNQGRSAAPIGKTVKWIFDGQRRGDPVWHAGPADSGWVVSLEYHDADKIELANWSFDPKTKKVRYLDPAAKVFSFMPRE